MEKHKQGSERAKRRIDSQQLCHFTALDKQTKHELMMNKRRLVYTRTYGTRQMAKGRAAVTCRDEGGGACTVDTWST